MRISDEEFEHEVETAIDSLPDRFKRALDNVGIAVADEPNERERATMQRQCDELLGLYEGVPITRRFTGYSGVMPDIITIYKGPHERVCATRDDLRRQCCMSSAIISVLTTIICTRTATEDIRSADLYGI